MDIWNRLYSNIVQNGHVQACAPLINYLQYHMLGGGPDNAAIYNESDLTQPRVNSAFLRHRSLVLSDLQMSNAAGTPSTNIRSDRGLSAADLQVLISALQAGHTNPAPTPGGGSTSNPTTIDRRWAVNLPSLLKLYMVQSVNQLPPVWSALAKGPKKEETTILQSALDNHP